MILVVRPSTSGGTLQSRSCSTSPRRGTDPSGHARLCERQELEDRSPVRGIEWVVDVDAIDVLDELGPEGHVVGDGAKYVAKEPQALGLVELGGANIFGLP